jgi:hypothetical protein
MKWNAFQRTTSRWRPAAAISTHEEDGALPRRRCGGTLSGAAVSASGASPASPGASASGVRSAAARAVSRLSSASSSCSISRSIFSELAPKRCFLPAARQGLRGGCQPRSRWSDDTPSAPRGNVKSLIQNCNHATLAGGVVHAGRLVDPLPQHRQLRRRQPQGRAVCRRGPWESALLEHLVVQAEALAVPVEQLDPVAALPAMQNTAPEAGFCFSTNCACAAKPAMPLLMSVTPQAR